jgi:hypothetical protein
MAEPAPQAHEAPTERSGQEAQDREGPMGKVVHVHTAHPRVPIPYVTPGDLFAGARGATSRLPSLRKMTYYGLLGGMTVVGALEWPVALAVGAATEVITREQSARKRAERKEQRQQTSTESPTQPETAWPGQAAMA